MRCLDCTKELISPKAQRCKGCSNRVNAKKRHSEGGFYCNIGNSYRLGKKHSLEAKRKIREGLKGKYVGENNWNYKGEKVEYRALHNWVESRLGKPEKCEHCSKTGLSGHRIHWANKSGEYKRDLLDWLRLCAKCHKKYDICVAHS